MLKSIVLVQNYPFDRLLFAYLVQLFCFPTFVDIVDPIIILIVHFLGIFWLDWIKNYFRFIIVRSEIIKILF